MFDYKPDCIYITKNGFAMKLVEGDGGPGWFCLRAAVPGAWPRSNPVVPGEKSYTPKGEICYGGTNRPLTAGHYPDYYIDHEVSQ